MRRFGTRLAIVTALVLGANSAANAANASRYSFSGDSAFVAFMGSATITCSDGSLGFVATVGSLYGSQQVTIMTDVPTYMTNGIYVQIDQYANTCTGLSFAYSSGGVPYGFTPPDKKMESSALAGSAQIQDFSTGALIPVTFDIDVVGTGPTSQSKSHSKTTVKGTKSGPITLTTNHSNNTNRSAEGSGTMVVNGVSLPLDIIYANMSSNGTSQNRHHQVVRATRGTL